MNETGKNKVGENIYVVIANKLQPVFCYLPADSKQDEKGALLRNAVTANNKYVISLEQWLKEHYLPVIMNYLHLIIKDPAMYLNVGVMLKSIVGTSQFQIISHDANMAIYLRGMLDALQPSNGNSSSRTTVVYNEQANIAQQVIAGQVSVDKILFPDVYATCAVPASSHMFGGLKKILTETHNDPDFKLTLELIYEILKLRLHVTTLPTIWSTMRQSTTGSHGRTEQVQSVSMQKFEEFKKTPAFEKFYQSMQTMDVHKALTLMRQKDLNYHTDVLNVMYSACCARILAAQLCTKVQLEDTFKDSDFDKFCEFWKKFNSAPQKTLSGRQVSKQYFDHNVSLEYWYYCILPTLYEKLEECGAISSTPGTENFGAVPIGPRFRADNKPAAASNGAASGAVNEQEKQTVNEEEKMAIEALLKLQNTNVHETQKVKQTLQDLEDAWNIASEFDDAAACPAAGLPNKRGRSSTMFSTTTMVQNLMAKTAQMHIH